MNLTKNVLILAALFGLTFACALPERKSKAKPKRLTKSEKILICMDNFIYKFEIDPKIALELCEKVYENKAKKNPYIGETIK